MKKNKPVIPKQSIICQEKKRKVTYTNTQCLQAKQINVNWTCTHGLSRKNARGRPQVAKIAHPENMQAATSSSPGASKSCKFLFNVRRTCPQINGKADPFNKRVKRHNEEISPLSALADHSCSNYSRLNHLFAAAQTETSVAIPKWHLLIPAACQAHFSQNCWHTWYLSNNINDKCLS